MATSTGKAVTTGPSSSVSLMTPGRRRTPRRGPVASPAGRLTASAHPRGCRVRTTASGPVAVAVDGTVQVIVSNLGNRRHSTIT